MQQALVKEAPPEYGSILTEHEPINRALSRFIRKIEERDGHWLWRAARFRPAKYAQEYGYFYYQGRMVYAHRWAYEAFVGPIPEGMTIDHLCRNGLCVYPAHLEAVPHIINIQRGNGQVHPIRREAAGGLCRRGHWMDVDNTYVRPSGKTDCRRCHADRNRLARARLPTPERQEA